MEKNIALINALFDSIEEYSQPQYTTFLKGDKKKNEILSNDPHMLIIMWIMSANFNAEKASNIPFALQERLGRVDMKFLATLPLQHIENAMQGLHRFSKTRAGYLYSMAKFITEKYDGNPANIWLNNVSSTEITRRLREITGFGPELSKMVPINLVRNFHMNFPDIKSMDVKVDVHLKRVMMRIGLSGPEADNHEVAKNVREAAEGVGRYPVELDLPLWATGKWYCHKQNPSCGTCPLYSECTKLIVHEENKRTTSVTLPKQHKTQMNNKSIITISQSQYNNVLISDNDFWSTLKQHIKSENISSSEQKVKSGYMLDVTMGTAGVFTNIETHSEYIDVSIMIVTRWQMSSNSKTNVMLLKGKNIEQYFDSNCQLIWNNLNFSGNSTSKQKVFIVRKNIQSINAINSINFVVDTLKKCKDIINKFIK
jgi:endonuclease III